MDYLLFGLLFAVMLISIYSGIRRDRCKNGERHEYNHPKFDGFYISYKCKKCDSEIVETMFY